MAYIPRRYAIPDPVPEGRTAQSQMNPTEIEFAVRDLVARPFDPESFPYGLMGCYNASKMTVSRLMSGATNKAKHPGDLLWQKYLFFRPAKPGEDVGAIGDQLAADPLTAKYKPRFILVTNGEQFHARDFKLDDTLNAVFAELDEKSDFFLPLAGYERRAVVEEHPADIKAAKKLKKLYDALLAANPTWSSGHHTHELNLLMTRLLFCFYAEDTGIFDTPQIFTNTLTQQTTEDGNDVAPLLDRLFRVMNVQEGHRPKNTPSVEAKFPYVNGSLFEDTVEIPQFSRTARRQMLECGDLDWTTINPDIFGSMIQTIAQDGTRSDLGMHYTSVPNIMKVLQPLFLNDLREALEKANDSVPKLQALLGRLSKIRVFDPACGSGNFLIISYRELRKIEIEILQRITELAPKTPLPLSNISLHNFYGIDIVDFACETAKLSLWIVEHQMNSKFAEIFGSVRPTLPLSRITSIQLQNALREDWLVLCPIGTTGLEIYVCGNPPYSGRAQQTAIQKEELAAAFAQFPGTFRRLDYISGWFIRASAFVQATGAKAAFVSTNSICQGEHVPALWPLIYSFDVEIAFAHTSFRWGNSAAHNAFVYCIIVGLSRNNDNPKFLYNDDHVTSHKVIGPYLVPDSITIVTPWRNPAPLDRPTMVFGNMPNDGGHLILRRDERDHLLESYPAAAALIRPFVGSEDFINSIERYCLWIDGRSLEIALSIPPIKKRIDAVREVRLKSPRPGTIQQANVPYAFAENRHGGAAILVPSITSERRPYLTIGFVDERTIISNKAFAVYNPEGYLFALLSSRLHWLWNATVGGRAGNLFQYANTLVYNTFPIPALSNDQKRALDDSTREILRSRARYPGKTIAWLYNPETMPQGISDVHKANDAYIEKSLYGRDFADDAARVAYLLSMYARTRPTSSDGLFGKIAVGKDS